MMMALNYRCGHDEIQWEKKIVVIFVISVALLVTTWSINVWCLFCIGMKQFNFSLQISKNRYHKWVGGSVKCLSWMDAKKSHSFNAFALFLLYASLFLHSHQFKQYLAEIWLDTFDSITKLHHWLHPIYLHCTVYIDSTLYPCRQLMIDSIVE